jgi:polysaccharide biosynthesis protein PslH
MEAKPLVLVVSPTPTHPPDAGNRVRLARLLERLEKWNVPFHFVFFRAEDASDDAMVARWGRDRCTVLDFKHPPDRANLWMRARRWCCRQVGVEFQAPMPIDALYCRYLERRVMAIAAAYSPQVVMVEYVFYSWLLRNFGPSVRKVIDTHDVFTNRHERFRRTGVRAEWYWLTRRSERKGLNRADCIIAIQDREREFFSSLVDRPVITVGHEVEICDLSRSEAAEPTLLLVGSHNSINQDGARYFLAESWPRVCSQFPEARLEVCGGLCRHLDAAPGMVLRGEIADIKEAYARAWVVIVPLRFGTGLKIKTIEAMGYGKAVVSTPAGAEGLEPATGKCLQVAENPDEFAARCLELLKSSELRHELGRLGLELAESSNLRQEQALNQALFGATARQPD